MSSSMLTAVSMLRKEGRLHPKLRTRLRMMSAIAAVMALITVHGIAFRDVPGWYAFGLFALGLPLGAYVFSSMTKVEWDERREVIGAGRMDVFGFSVIVLYIVFEIFLKRLLKQEFSATTVATGLIIATVCGNLFGRVIGTMAAIHKLSTAARPEPPAVPS